MREVKAFVWIKNIKIHKTKIKKVPFKHLISLKKLLAAMLIRINNKSNLLIKEKKILLIIIKN